MSRTLPTVSTKFTLKFVLKNTPRLPEITLPILFKYAPRNGAVSVFLDENPSPKLFTLHDLPFQLVAEIFHYKSVIKFVRLVIQTEMLD